MSPIRKSKIQVTKFAIQMAKIPFQKTNASAIMQICRRIKVQQSIQALDNCDPVQGSISIDHFLKQELI